MGGWGGKQTMDDKRKVEHFCNLKSLPDMVQISVS